MIEILDSTAAHARELSQTMREKDFQEALAMGHDPRKAVFYTYRRAIYRKTILVDGRVAAMYGVCGTPMGYVGTPYLLTSPEVYRVSPFTFVRLYNQGLTEMKKLFPVLENYVMADYKEAVRMLEITGFDLEGSIILNDAVFLKFSIRGDSWV